MIQCRQLCDTINQCYGFEYDSTSASTNYGGCEIWVVDITTSQGAGSNFACYKKKSRNTAAIDNKVMAGFDITGVNISAILADAAALANMTGTLWPLATSHINTSIMTLETPTAADVTPLANGGVHLRMTFSSNTLHPATLHNYVRNLAVDRYFVGFNQNTQSKSPGFVSQALAYFNTLTAFHIANQSPAVTADFTTLLQLAPALPTPAPIPTPAPTTVDSAHSNQPILFLISWSVATIMWW